MNDDDKKTKLEDALDDVCAQSGLPASDIADVLDLLKYRYEEQAAGEQQA